jgi:hypothetical protein
MSREYHLSRNDEKLIEIVMIATSSLIGGSFEVLSWITNSVLFLHLAVVTFILTGPAVAIFLALAINRQRIIRAKRR